MRHAAQVASQEWHVARAPQGDIFGRRITAAESTYRQVFNELDRRPMPTYKPGEPLDPLLELRENPRLLQSALDEMHSIRRRLMRLPVVVRPREGDEPRIVTVADTYLKASDSRWDSEWVVWFLEEVQKADPLTLRELWAFPTAVKFLLVEEVLTQARAQIEDPDAFDLAAQGLLAARFDGIRNAIYANWAQMIEGLVVFNAVLRQDPVGSYPQMDFDSRERYRDRVSEIARHSDLSELEVAQAALRLAQRPVPENTAPRQAARRTHVGYYLIDKGFPLLAAEVGYRPRWIDRARIFARRNADDVYILGILMLTVILIGAIMVPLVPNYSIVGGLTAAFLFLLIPTAQGAVDLVNNMVAALFKAAGLPKLEFPKGLPPELTTLVAIPTLLLNEKQVRELIEDLEVRYLANQDPNLHFALLSDLPDSVSRPRPNDTDPLVELAVGLINNLNARYAHKNRRWPRRRRLLSAASAPHLQRAAGRVDGLGAQARQAAGPEQIHPRRVRQLPGKDRQHGRAAHGALRHHARLRYATAARHGARDGRRDGAPAESRGDRSGVAHCHRGLRNPAAAGGRQRALGVALAAGGDLLRADGL